MTNYEKGRIRHYESELGKAKERLKTGYNYKQVLNRIKECQRRIRRIEEREEKISENKLREES